MKLAQRLAGPEHESGSCPRFVVGVQHELGEGLGAPCRVDAVLVDVGWDHPIADAARRVARSTAPRGRSGVGGGISDRRSPLLRSCSDAPSPSSSGSIARTARTSSMWFCRTSLSAPVWS